MILAQCRLVSFPLGRVGFLKHLPYKGVSLIHEGQLKLKTILDSQKKPKQPRHPLNQQRKSLFQQ